MHTEGEPNRVIRRILRVDHAGEHGAVAIYSSQIEWAKRHAPDLLPWLEETIAHERTHRERFRSAMPARAAKPCRLLSIWSVGGAVLGWATARLGRTGVMVCTSAVERTVHAHLVEQRQFLLSHDPELHDVVASIQAEEDEHLAYADQRHDPGKLLPTILRPLVEVATETLIFVSTRGDSLRLRHAMTTAH
jgi:3-demethoxyubiquinol 3-hydroxylase